MYESFVYYNSKTFDVEPVLATAWKEISPTQVRFTLRQGVKFGDRRGVTLDVSREVKFLTQQIAVLGTERLDIVSDVTRP